MKVNSLPVVEVASAKAEAMSLIASADTLSTLREVRAAILGKEGSLTGLLKQIARFEGDKKAFGAAVNTAKSEIEAAFSSREITLQQLEATKRFEEERMDVTLPGRKLRFPRQHVLQQAIDDVIRILGGLGFTYAEGPEIEEFRYNFEALRYPPDHPAMDDQDTFYLDDTHVLRTQGTALQGRIFERVKPPLRFFTVGRTYRNEAVDRTHSHTFHQVDCFMIDEGVSMAHLRGTLEHLASQLFGNINGLRFRPDFFPFVEPGVDFAISSPSLFGGKWVELGGAGLIHPDILANYGIDNERYTGFAFGLGVERIPMMQYGIEDLRQFLENDLRFLEQFPV